MTERKTQGGEILIEEQHSAAEINEINELYSVQQKLDEAGDEAKQQPELYDKVIAAVKKSPKAKKFAAQLIPRYFSLFPDKSEQALNAQLDLCEEEDLQIRTNAIKGLPELSKKNQDYSGNIAHVLVQILAAADKKIELDTIKISLLKILNESNTQEVRSLLFTHVDENPEGLGTKFINLLERVPMHKLQNTEDTLVEKLKSLWAISNLSDFPKFARIIIQLDLFKEAGDATKLEEFINANKNFNINDPIKASETDKIKQLIDIANSLMPLFKTSPCCTPFLSCFVNLNNQSGEIEEHLTEDEFIRCLKVLSPSQPEFVLLDLFDLLDMESNGLISIHSFYFFFLLYIAHRSFLMKQIVSNSINYLETILEYKPTLDEQYRFLFQIFEFLGLSECFQDTWQEMEQQEMLENKETLDTELLSNLFLSVSDKNDAKKPQECHHDNHEAMHPSSPEKSGSKTREEEEKGYRDSTEAKEKEDEDEDEEMSNPDDVLMDRKPSISEPDPKDQKRKTRCRCCIVQ